MSYELQTTDIKIYKDITSTSESNYSPELLYKLETGKVDFGEGNISIDDLLSTPYLYEASKETYRLEGCDVFRTVAVNTETDTPSDWTAYTYSNLWSSTDKNKGAVWHSRFLKSDKYQYLDLKTGEYQDVIDNILLPGCYPHFNHEIKIYPDPSDTNVKNITYATITYSTEFLNIKSFNSSNTVLDSKTYVKNDFRDDPDFKGVIPTKILIGLVGAGGRGGDTGFLKSGGGGGGGGTVIGILDLTAVDPDADGHYTYYVEIGLANGGTTKLRCYDKSGKVLATGIGGGNGGSGSYSGGSGGGTTGSTAESSYKYFYLIASMAGGNGGGEHTNGGRVYPHIAYVDGTYTKSVNESGNPVKPSADGSKTVVSNETRSYMIFAEDGYMDSSTSNDGKTHPGLGGRSGGGSCGGGGGASAFARGGHGAWGDGDAGRGKGPGAGGGGGSALQSSNSYASGLPGALYIWF